MTCPSGKVSYKSERHARGGARQVILVRNREGEYATDVYTYRCADCRQWHLTRRAEWNGVPNTFVLEAPPVWLQRWAITGEPPVRLVDEETGDGS